MVNEAVIWAIFLLPFGSFAFAALVVRPFFNRYSLISGLATIAALGTALGFSIWTLRSVILGHDLEFRSQIEIAYRFDDRARLGLSLSHMSSASIGDKNPGTESIMVTYALPIENLF